MIFTGLWKLISKQKKRLFFELLKDEGVAVINLDDDYGKILNSEIRKSDFRVKILTYGLSKEADFSGR